MPHGSWLAVSREKIISIGGYDQRFKRYGNEDHDIVQRLRRLGLKHISSTNIVALHPEFDSGRPSSNLDNIAKDLQMEIQRDPSVIRNQDTEWGRYTEIEDKIPQIDCAPIGGLQENLKVEAVANTISSISDSLTLLASSAKKIDTISNMVRNMHTGYVSLENPLFQRKKHSSKEKEILKLYKLSDSTGIATDSKEIKNSYDCAKFLNELGDTKDSVDFLILTEIHRQRNLGSYLDRAYNLLSPKGVCIVLCPAYSNNIGSGNTNSLWNAGYIIYNLIMAGFDCKNSKVSTFESEIQLSASKTHRRATSFSIADCFDYFPFDAYQHFNGNIKELNWFPENG